MTVENISWLNHHERMLLTRRGSNPQPPDHQSDAHPTEPPRPAEGCRKDCRFAKSKPHTSPEAAPYINPFTPELLKWIIPSLYLGMSFIANGVSVKNKNRMENGIDPDEIAHYESSHLDLHCLQRCLVWSAELKGLTECEVHFIIWGNNSACYGYIQRWLYNEQYLIFAVEQKSLLSDYNDTLFSS